MTAARVCVVVPSERHVERLSRGARERGESVETRDALRARLLASLAPGVVLASAADARVALADALPAVAARDALLAPIARAGGVAWFRTVDAVDAALGALRAAAVDEASLATRAPPAIAGRAQLLHGALRAVDAALSRAGLVDARSAGTALARALGEADPERVCDAVGADRVVAKWILAWDGGDVAWWRALDVALRRARRDGAIVQLPAIDRPLDAEREQAPFDIVADDVARALDEAPELVALRTPLGDLSLAASLDDAAAAAIELRHAIDARAQARAAVDAVRAALAAGTPPEAIAIALPSPNDETLVPLRAALDDSSIVASTSQSLPASRTGLAVCALDALSVASRGLARRDVASLLRSRYVDASALSRESKLSAGALARALEETATARAADPVAALEATARAWARANDAPESPLGAFARAVGAALTHVDQPRTRAEHVAAARALWTKLGIGPCAERATASAPANDTASSSIERAAARAAAADARAWAAIDDVLRAMTSASKALGLAERAIAADSFLHDIASALDDAPDAATTSDVAAIRIASLEELAGAELALLVVLDANDGVLPSNDRDPFVSDALATWLRERGRAAPASSKLLRARELASLAAAASGARRIVFASRERDDAAALLAPAPLVAWLARSGVRTTRWSASPLAGDALSAHEEKLRALVGGLETAQAAAIAPDAARRALIERARESLFEAASPARTELRGALGSDAARDAILAEETGGGERAMSVTALERVATCAFQGFASQVLRARDGDVVDERPDARDTGNLVHGALAAAFEATADLWSARPRDAAAITTRALAAVDAFLDAEPPASSLRRIEIERARADIAAVIAWSIADDDWDFAGAEVTFGAAEGWPAVVVEDEATRVALRGTIDRVDVGHGRAAVRALDYKSGAGALDSGNRIGETSFQVAIYARAAAAGHRVAEVDGLYVPTRARTLAIFKRTQRQLDAWRDAHADAGGRPAIDVRAIAVVRALRRGGLMPAPYDEASCARCRFDGGCRKPRFAIRVDDEGEGEGSE